MTDLTRAISVPRLLKSKDEGRQLLEILIRHLPGHVPHSCGQYEPLKNRFDANDLDLVLEHWGGPYPAVFIADRRQPRFYFHVSFAPESASKPRYTVIWVHHIEATDWEEVLAFKNFVTDAASAFGADLAVAHIHTRAEVLEGIDYLRTLPGTNPEHMVQRVQREGVATVLHGMTTMQYVQKKLGLYLPDLPWLTVFGRPYVELFGTDRLAATPAYEVRATVIGSFLINVTRNLEDTAEGWEAFKDVRDRCKHHLTSDAFFDPRAPAGHIYRVPNFRFPLEMYRAPTLA